MGVGVVGEFPVLPLLDGAGMKQVQIQTLEVVIQGLGEYAEKAAQTSRDFGRGVSDARRWVEVLAERLVLAGDE